MVLAGLKEVHKNSFLHLDIKPSNILLRASGVPLILDLGAAYKFPTTVPSSPRSVPVAETP